MRGCFQGTLIMFPDTHLKFILIIYSEYHLISPCQFTAVKKSVIDDTVTFAWLGNYLQMSKILNILGQISSFEQISES